MWLVGGLRIGWKKMVGRRERNSKNAGGGGWRRERVSSGMERSGLKGRNKGHTARRARSRSWDSRKFSFFYFIFLGVVVSFENSGEFRGVVNFVGVVNKIEFHHKNRYSKKCTVLPTQLQYPICTALPVVDLGCFSLE